ncbi:MAG: Omp28-related outer membrane protein [Bacteroidia bacterium]|jgi:hypothetical protein|nr:Omp28-related outer membrane protein [Bacteroidia bacterium]
MKKFNLFTLGVLAAMHGFAQLPASRNPQNQKVVLEEFTGINCVWCPDGHKRAAELKEAKPTGDVVLVNIHTGGFATPGAGQIDLRTTEGNSIAGMQGMGITGYPSGTVNRTVWTGSAMAINRGLWAQYADSVLARQSWVNVAAQATINVATRQLTVEVEAYYTGNSPVPTNAITVALLENNIRGSQTGGADLNPSQVNEDGTYNHMHALRKIITPTFGDPITTTTSGTSFTKTYTYPIPASILNVPVQLGELEVVVFVAKSNTEIVTAAYAPITLTGFTTVNDAAVSNIVAEKEICAGNLNPKVRITNTGSATINSIALNVSANNGTASTFNTSISALKPFTSTEIALDKITFTPVAGANIVNVTVGTVNGVADEGASNNTTASAAIPLTSRVSNANAVFMEFTQDQYGEESSWELVNETTGEIIATDGPFTNLNTAGTVLHTQVITGLIPNTCYVLRVKDTYGDGINAGTGVGGYKLKAGSNYIITSNGQFGAEDYKTFKTGENLTTRVDEVASIADAHVYPNPSKTESTIAFTSLQDQVVTVEVFNQLGALVTRTSKKVKAGNQTISLDCSEWATGFYGVNLITEQSVLQTRIVVSH